MKLDLIPHLLGPYTMQYAMIDISYIQGQLFIWDDCGLILMLECARMFLGIEFFFKHILWVNYKTLKLLDYQKYQKDNFIIAFD